MLDKSTNVIILAAGSGTRLKHLTESRPKCLVQFLGKPLILHQLETYRKADLQNITIVGGYYAESLQITGIKIIINERYAETNMVYSLFCAEQSMIRGSDLIISYGDIVFELRILEALMKSNAPLNVVVDRNWLSLWRERMDNPLEDAETLRLSKENRILELGNKPDSYEEIEGQYIGLIKVSADHISSFISSWRQLDRDKMYNCKNADNMYMTSFLQHLIDSGWDARAVFTDGGWLEIDTVEDITRYEYLQSKCLLQKYYDHQK